MTQLHASRTLRTIWPSLHQKKRAHRSGVAVSIPLPSGGHQTTTLRTRVRLTCWKKEQPRASRVVMRPACLSLLPSSFSALRAFSECGASGGVVLPRLRCGLIQVFRRFFLVVEERLEKMVEVSGKVSPSPQEARIGADCVTDHDLPCSSLLRVFLVCTCSSRILTPCARMKVSCNSRSPLWRPFFVKHGFEYKGFSCLWGLALGPTGLRCAGSAVAW